jgi:hypothetical protein
VLKFCDPPSDSSPASEADQIRLSCRKRDCEYLVRVATPEVATAPAIEARLAALLWSGDAA